MAGIAWVAREAPDQPYGGESADRKVTDGQSTSSSASDRAPELQSAPGFAADGEGFGTATDDALDQRDSDAIEALGEEVVTSFAHADVLTQRGLALLAEFDRRRGWELAGYPSCADWLAARGRIDVGTAREKVRTARALAGLPLTNAAMARGELTFCQVRALTRAATPANEEDLLPLAQDASVKELERMIRAWKKGTRQTEAAREREIHDSRTLSVFPDDDGGYVLKARLTAEQGALLRRVLEAASDALFGENPSVGQTNSEKHKEAGQRRADALALMAERAMAAGFGPPADDCDVPISGGSADRYQVVLHVQQETLSVDGELAMSELEDGTRVSHATARRIACDATVVTVTRKPDGTVLDVGRKRRSVPWRLRRALEIRDRGCRFPGCGRRFTQGHHVTHWADGGGTSLENCLLLCRYHHGLVHEGGWEIGFGAERRPIFFDPRGHLHYDGRWQPPSISHDVIAALLDEPARPAPQTRA
jgi:hypothetical protein